MPEGDTNLRISVIIPAFNEQESIGKVLQDIPLDLVQEVIVADNGSTDTTALSAREAGARVVCEQKRGYGAACLAGIAAADNPDILVFLDGDYSDYPQDMYTLLKPIMNKSADFVVGSRIMNGNINNVLPRHAYWGNVFCAGLIRMLYNHTYTDFGPFRAITADSLYRLQMRDLNYGWTAEMQVKAVKNRLRIREVPVRYRRRIGKSKVSGTLSGSVKAGSKIIYTILKHTILK